MLCLGKGRGAQLEKGRARGSAGSQMAPRGVVAARQELESGSRLESEAVWEWRQAGGKETVVGVIQCHSLCPCCW